MATIFPSFPTCCMFAAPLCPLVERQQIYSLSLLPHEAQKLGTAEGSDTCRGPVERLGNSNTLRSAGHPLTRKDPANRFCSPFGPQGTIPRCWCSTRLSGDVPHEEETSRVFSWSCGQLSYVPPCVWFSCFSASFLSPLTLGALGLCPRVNTDIPDSLQWLFSRKPVLK